MLVEIVAWSGVELLDQKSQVRYPAALCLRSTLIAEGFCLHGSILNLHSDDDNYIDNNCIDNDYINNE